MGGINSSRWGNYRRKLTIQECEEMRARVCPCCQRPVKFLYRPPYREIFGDHQYEWACRLCHRLNYIQQTLGNTLAGRLAADPDAANEARREAFALLANATIGEPPEPEQFNNSIRAYRRWQRENESLTKTALHIMAAADKIPAFKPLKRREK